MTYSDLNVYQPNWKIPNSQIPARSVAMQRIAIDLDADDDDVKLSTREVPTDSGNQSQGKYVYS